MPATEVPLPDQGFIEKAYDELRRLFDGADLDKSGTMEAEELAKLTEKMWFAMGEPLGPKSTWVSRGGAIFALLVATLLHRRTDCLGRPTGKLLSRRMSLKDEVASAMSHFDTDGEATPSAPRNGFDACASHP